MHTVAADTTNVDRGQAVRLSVRALTVAIRPVTDEMRHNHPGIPPLARWAAVAYTDTGRGVVWLTDATPGVGNLVTTTRDKTREAGARFVDPDAECEQCGTPLVEVEHRFCPPTGQRDCEALYRMNETGWRTPATVGPIRTAGHPSPARDLPAVA